MGKEVILKVKGFTFGDKRYAGYYNHERIADGREFVLKSEKDFSPLWMKPIGWKPQEPISENQKIAKKEIIRSGAGKPVGAVETNKNKAAGGEKMSMSQLSGTNVGAKPQEVKPGEVIEEVKTDPVQEIDIDDETPNPAEEAI